MKIKLIKLLFLLLIIIPRIWKLGQIPAGVSINEAKFSINLSKLFGNIIFNTSFERTLFFLFGVLSILVFYKLIILISNDQFYAYLSAVILAITPWHIQQSRVFSPGIIILLTILLFFYIIFRYQLFDRIYRYLLFTSLIIFIISIFTIPKEIRQSVNLQRELASRSELVVPVELITNKYTESFRYRTAIFFENLDIGNYYFKGYPRERWGVEETKKLFVCFLPFMLIGLMHFNKRAKKLAITWSVLSLSVIILFAFRSPDLTLILIIPLILCISSGLYYLFKHESTKNNLLLYSMLLLSFVEGSNYIYSYFGRQKESVFSDRRVVFKELVYYTDSLANKDVNILVNERLGTPEIFFRYYLKNKKLSSYEFRNFNIGSETNRNKVFVDVLPDDPSPSEPLFNIVTNPKINFKILNHFYDEQLRQTVYVYNL
jgi:hypothetical protein